MSPAAQRRLGNLVDHAHRSVAEMIRERGGNAANVRQAGPWANETLEATAEAAAGGSRTAATALKIVKQAKRLGESTEEHRMTMVTNVLSVRQPSLLPVRDAAYELVGVLDLLADDYRSELVLLLADGYLQFQVDEDTDSLAAQFHEGELPNPSAYRNIGSTAPWNQYLNREVGWTWIAVNQQGYCDTAMISFDGIVPNVMLHALGSAIGICSISPLDGGNPA